MVEDGSTGTGADVAPAVGADGPREEQEAGSDALAGDPSSLFVWATGSFHAALLVAVLVAALHWSGSAGDLLAGVGTLPGALAYLYLWGVTLATTRKALNASGVTAAGSVADGRNALWAALRWGGATGIGFFAALFVVVAGLLLVNVGIGAVPAVFVVGLVGGLLAALVGAVVGAVLAAVDLAMLRAAVRVTGDLSGSGP